MSASTEEERSRSRSLEDRQEYLGQGARWLVEGFRPAFLATANGAQTMAQVAADVHWEEFTNALREVEQAEAKNGKNPEA
jgi:hypothetical protein